MRRLHPVGKHEKFIASGIYRQYEGESAAGLVEYWSIHETGGAQFMRIDQDSRAADGRSVLMEVLRSPEGSIERVDLHAYGRAGDAVRQAKASYNFFEDRSEIIRIVNNQQYQEEISLPAGWVLDIGPALLFGLMVPRMAAAGSAQITAFAPLWQFHDPQHALEGTLRALPPFRYADTLTIERMGRSWQARLYQTMNEDTQIFLDDYDILLERSTPPLTTRLTQYARRPERT